VTFHGVSLKPLPVAVDGSDTADIAVVLFGGCFEIMVLRSGSSDAD